MADFLGNLWESVFTPGPTPTLLIATNVTFAFLQITLAALLVLTYSIHFVILSILCGGLWWSINWFAEEVRQAQEKEEEAKRIRKRQERDRQVSKDGESADDEGGETETEATMSTPAVASSSVPEYHPSLEDEEIKAKIIDDIRKSAKATEAANTTALQAPDETRMRKSTTDMTASSTDNSTDSEWERVDSEK